MIQTWSQVDIGGVRGGTGEHCGRGLHGAQHIYRLHHRLEREWGFGSTASSWHSLFY